MFYTCDEQRPSALRVSRSRSSRCLHNPETFAFFVFFELTANCCSLLLNVPAECPSQTMLTKHHRPCVAVLSRRLRLFALTWIWRCELEPLGLHSTQLGFCDVFPDDKTCWNHYRPYWTSANANCRWAGRMNHSFTAESHGHDDCNHGHRKQKVLRIYRSAIHFH